MPKLEHLEEYVKFVAAFRPAGWTTGAITAIAVDASGGFDRVCYIIPVGDITTVGGSIDTEVTESATSGGAYTLITGSGITAITQANENTVIVVDVPVNVAKPFQKLRTTAVKTVEAAAVAILYNGNGTRPVTQTVNQYVEV